MGASDRCGQYETRNANRPIQEKRFVCYDCLHFSREEGKGTQTSPQKKEGLTARVGSKVYTEADGILSRCARFGVKQGS